jgi:hypothetical protein
MNPGRREWIPSWAFSSQAVATQAVVDVEQDTWGVRRRDADLVLVVGFRTRWMIRHAAVRPEAAEIDPGMTPHAIAGGPEVCSVRLAAPPRSGQPPGILGTYAILLALRFTRFSRHHYNAPLSSCAVPYDLALGGNYLCNELR